MTRWTKTSNVFEVRWVHNWGSETGIDPHPLPASERCVWATDSNHGKTVIVGTRSSHTSRVLDGIPLGDPGVGRDVGVGITTSLFKINFGWDLSRWALESKTFERSQKAHWGSDPVNPSDLVDIVVETLSWDGSDLHDETFVG